MDIDRNKVDVEIELGYVYQIKFKWYRGARKLKEDHGDAVGVIIGAQKLFTAYQMRECLNEWHYDLDKDERRAYKRLNARYFD